MQEAVLIQEYFFLDGQQMYLAIDKYLRYCFISVFITVLIY